jgi:high-affinity Fe2+/Pb2+ permease
MRQKAFIKPTKPALVLGLIVAIFMLLFGIFFFALLTEERAGIGQIFMIFWMLVVISMIIYFAYGIRNFEKNNVAGISQEINLPDSFQQTQVGDSFDDRIRKLEKLKNDGLISTEEYEDKRKQIMSSHW